MARQAVTNHFTRFLTKTYQMVTGMNQIRVVNRNSCSYLSGDGISKQTFVKNECQAPFSISQYITKNKLKEKLLPKGCGVFDRRKFKGVSIDYTPDQVIVEMELGDWKAEDINIRMEGSWLVMEGSKTVRDPDDGGLVVRHVLRRWELPQVSPGNMNIARGEKTIKITMPLAKS